MKKIKIDFNFIQNAVYNSKSKYINVGNFPEKNKGFISVNLDKFIKNNKINYWIFGHSHINFGNKIYNTNCVSNQLGYVICSNYNEEENIDLILKQKTHLIQKNFLF